MLEARGTTTHAQRRQQNGAEPRQERSPQPARPHPPRRVQGLTRAPAAPLLGGCGGAVGRWDQGSSPSIRWPPLPSPAPSARCTCPSRRVPARPPASPASRSMSAAVVVLSKSPASYRCAQPRPWPVRCRPAMSAPFRCSEASAFPAGAPTAPPAGQGRVDVYELIRLNTRQF